jgi:hypothetical protein
MEEAPKKGMSKGCMIGLIIGIIIIVIVIIGGVLCYTYKDDLAKASVGMLVGSVKTHLVETPVEGVDTVQFNAVADAFVVKVEEKEFDPVKYQGFAMAVQSAMQQEPVTADDVDQIVEAMTDYFPELKELIPEPEEMDSTMVEEMTETEE